MAFFQSIRSFFSFSKKIEKVNVPYKEMEEYVPSTPLTPPVLKEFQKARYKVNQDMKEHYSLTMYYFIVGDFTLTDLLFLQRAFQEDRLNYIHPLLEVEYSSLQDIQPEAVCCLIIKW